MATATYERTEKDFRVCPDTTYRVHRAAEPLMTINAVLGVVFLLIGGIAALLMGLHKIPGNPLGLTDSAGYYRIVTIHGINMLILWIVFFEIAAVYFVSTAILNSKMASVPLGYLGLILMVLGAAMLEYSVFFDPDSAIMFTAYMPLKATPIFYVGYILFAVGVLVAGLNFFWTIYKAKTTGSYKDKSLPLTVYGVFVAVVIAVQAILNGAIVMIVALFHSLQGEPGVPDPTFFDADLWKQVFWGFGHSAQYINISATAAIWYALIALTLGAKPLNEKFSRIAFVLYLLFTVPVSVHHLIVDPAYSALFKMVNASILAFGLAIPSLIHVFVIPGAMEKKMREQGHTTGLFTWIRNLPWKEPGIGALFWSILLFAFGGILGSIQGTYQLNMITHNTLRINAHFHLTVVAATTIAFMGLAYYFIPLIPRRKILSPEFNLPLINKRTNLSALQPHIYGIGLAILASGMFIAGVLGAPRRTANDEFYTTSALWDVGLIILALGAIIAVIGGAIFVLQIVLSLLFGEKLPREGDETTPVPGGSEGEEPHTSSKLEAPGTLALGIGFMVLFMIFYVVTFLVLSQNWMIGPRL